MNKKQAVLQTCDNIINAVHILESKLCSIDLDRADSQLLELLAPIRAQLGTAREQYKEEKHSLYKHVEKKYTFGAPRFPHDNF